MNQQIPQHSKVAGQNPIFDSSRPTIRMPPVRYTGGPGTGGRRNIHTPIKMKRKITVISFSEPRTSTSQAKKENSHLADTDGENEIKERNVR